MAGKIDWSVLSGPYVSRRTMMKLAAATGSLPFASWLAACGGDDDDDDGEAAIEGDSSGAEEETTTPETEEGAATPASQVSGTAAPTTSGGSGEAKVGGTLRLGFGQLTEIPDLNPSTVNLGVVAGQLVSNLFSSLVQFDENLGLVADLAETWEVSEDGLDYTFHLRDGLKFHNGDPLTAEDLVYTFNRTTDPNFASPHANKLQFVTEINADDDLTLSMTLSEAFAPFLAVACSRGPGRAMTPVSKRAVEEMGDEQYNLTPVGCGPFKMVPETREIGQGFEMVAFEEWYGGRPYLDKIVVQVIPEPSSQASALAAGDIDMLNIVDTESVEQVRGNDQIEFIQAPGTNWQGLSMNYARPPWDNPKARMAVAKAIDRQDFVDRATFGLGVPSHSAIAPAFGWVYHEQDDNNPQAFNLEEAKALAKEAGLDGVKPVILSSTADPRVEEVLRVMLQEIGLDLQIDQLSTAAANERWLAEDYDMNVNGSVTDADPDDGHWNFFHSTGPWNTYNYESAKADELMEKTRTTVDVEERAQVWLELEQVLQEEIPYVFLFHTPDFTAFYNYVKGYRAIPEMRYLETVWLDK